jgi:hypothetical protein
MKDGEEALFLKDGSPEDIAGCCEHVFGDAALAASLGKRGAAFARGHFDLAANTAGLMRTYAAVLGQPERRCWAVVRETGASDLTAVANELADALQVAAGKNAPVPADLVSLASDLAVIVRLEDGRQSASDSASDRARIRLEERCGSWNSSGT